MSAADYYNRIGFSPYFYAHVIFNTVKSQQYFMRNLEDIFGDMYTSNWCEPFPRFTNLHQFIEIIVDSILFEYPIRENSEDHDLRDFCKYYRVDTSKMDWSNEDDVYDLRLWADYGDAMSALADEVFHILFPDVIFCHHFNEMIAKYVPRYGKAFGADDIRFTSSGLLKRVRAPQYVKRAIYHRDKGECRACKKRLDITLASTLKEHYDHIVPLAAGGVNDLSNMQLLCDGCNIKKGAREFDVSRLYPRAFPRGNN